MNDRDKKIRELLEIALKNGQEELPNTGYIRQALSLLKSRETCICMDCGKVIRVAEQSNHLKECPKEKSERKPKEPTEKPCQSSEFVKKCREFRKKGADEGQWEYATKLMEACDIIDKTKARIRAMYAGDLTPESRLSGYKVIVGKLRERRDELLKERLQLQTRLDKAGEEIKGFKKCCEEEKVVVAAREAQFKEQAEEIERLKKVLEKIREGKYITTGHSGWFIAEQALKDKDVKE